ncbi:MAG TPA: response regulator transcription factor, partial [Chloroflexota bacterium]|nr:response regulator transcription factor [Chloroflexota bacterium]
LAVRSGQAKLAAVLLAAADRSRADAGIRVPLAHHADTRHPAKDARVLLGEACFGEAWQEGEQSPLDQIVVEAAKVEVLQTAGLPQSKSTVTEDDSLAVRLSARELEVLRMVVEGYSDREIADTLSISRRTVTTHVSSILNKLGMNSRTSAAAYAVRHKLV